MFREISHDPSDTVIRCLITCSFFVRVDFTLYLPRLLHASKYQKHIITKLLASLNKLKIKHMKLLHNMLLFITY